MALFSQRQSWPALSSTAATRRETAMSQEHQTEDYADIREAVAKLCAQFPGEYWRKLDREMSYPKAFVDAQTQAGYLSVLIPEEYGGAGLKLSAAAAILEEIQRAGCNGGGCHAQMYTMGTVLRHGNRATSRRRSTSRRSPAASCGCRRSASPSRQAAPTLPRSIPSHARKATTATSSTARRSGPSQRRHSDLMVLLARTTPKEQAKKRTDGLSVFIVGTREAKNNGLEIRPIRTAAWTTPPPRKCSLPRHEGAGGEFDRRGSPKGLSLHPLRHERRALT